MTPGRGVGGGGIDPDFDGCRCSYKRGVYVCMCVTDCVRGGGGGGKRGATGRMGQRGEKAEEGVTTRATGQHGGIGAEVMGWWVGEGLRRGG